jgi:hypothetical protein
MFVAVGYSFLFVAAAVVGSATNLSNSVELLVAALVSAAVVAAIATILAKFSEPVARGAFFAAVAAAGVIAIAGIVLCLGYSNLDPAVNL